MLIQYHHLPASNSRCFDVA